MRDDELPAEAKRLIDAIASKPRFAGSAEESAARALCAAELRSAGFGTSEREFEFSEWPGRWGIPLMTAVLLVAILLIAGGAARSLDLATFVYAAAFAVGMRMMLSRRQTITLRMGALRSRSVNIEATRGGQPRVWLVAHLDSKSQSVPMLVRVLSHVALIAVAAVVMAMIFLVQWGVVHSVPWGWLATAGVITALPSLFCFVGNDSRGALDNATGVAAVLLAARQVTPGKSLGVLITSGEELDLAGARAWALAPPPDALMINCDTVDDSGTWRCMSGTRPQLLGVAAEKAAKKLGLALRMGRMIPGIITDSLAFETAGLPSVTLSRGTVGTLARLHTRGDNPHLLTGAGAAMAARMLAQMVEELT